MMNTDLCTWSPWAPNPKQRIQISGLEDFLNTLLGATGTTEVLEGYGNPALFKLLLEHLPCSLPFTQKTLLYLFLNSTMS